MCGDDESKMPHLISMKGSLEMAQSIYQKPYDGNYLTTMLGLERDWTDGGF